MKLLFSSLSFALLACVAFVTVSPVNAQVLGARPGYNSVLLKQEAKRQQFQAKLHATQMQQQGLAKASGAATPSPVQ